MRTRLAGVVGNLHRQRHFQLHITAFRLHALAVKRYRAFIFSVGDGASARRAGAAGLKAGRYTQMKSALASERRSHVGATFDVVGAILDRSRAG